MSAIKRILVATDDDTTFAQIDAALSDDQTEVRQIRAGLKLRDAVSSQRPALVVCDLQIGSMGGVAATLDLRAEEGAGRIGSVPILLLMDREADLFLARRSGADAWLQKPLEPTQVLHTVDALLADHPAAPLPAEATE